MCGLLLTGVANVGVKVKCRARIGEGAACSVSDWRRGFATSVCISALWHRSLEEICGAVHMVCYNVARSSARRGREGNYRSENVVRDECILSKRAGRQSSGTLGTC